jgi:hypothetical protein
VWSQSNIPPIRRSWRVKFATFRGMRSMGWTPTFRAKFSEWIPKASKPMGSKTRFPWRRWKRPWTSAPVKA